MIINGTRRELKKKILDYCLDNYDKEQIWLIDTLQVFDPYYFQETEKARLMLDNIKICRPFTLHQLRDKLFGFKKIPLNKNSTLIISSTNCFNEDVKSKQEITAIKNIIRELLKYIKTTYQCNIIVGKWAAQ